MTRIANQALDRAPATRAGDRGSFSRDQGFDSADAAVARG